MANRVRRFLSSYLQLSLVILATAIAGGLDLMGYDTVSHWILGVTAIISVIPLVMGMWQSLQDGSYGLDILALTAIVTSVLLQEYWAAILIVIMLTGGEALEDYAEARAKTELTSLLTNKPKKAHLVKGNNTSDIKVSLIKVGDKLRLLPGEVVPVDAEIIEGESSFDESSLTGESLPIHYTKGDSLLSGSVNIDGVVTIKALHTSADSQYEQIIKLVKSASAGQSPFVRLADRYSIPFTITAFLLAGTVWVLSGDPLRFLQVIVVATPCPLLLGAPIALISGMSRAAKHGVIVKTGSALERLAQVKTFAFDKTGTLTMGQPVVASIKTFNKFSKDEVINAAAALESSSTHVLAQAIINHVGDKKITPAKQVKEQAGSGLQGRVKNQSVLLGRLNFLAEHDIDVPASARQVNDTSVFLAIDGTFAGVITFKDKVRDESSIMLTQLRKLGIKNSLMVTGDNLTTAKAVAKDLGISDVVADCLPGDKIRAVEAVKNKPVAFVGDGVNDAPVLTVSDVGIALGARGSTAASETADIVILQDDISKVATGYAISKRTFFIAKQSILLGIFISLGLMGMFATGRFKPALGALLQEVVDVAVILNALRAHGSFRKKSVLGKLR